MIAKAFAIEAWQLEEGLCEPGKHDTDRQRENAAFQSWSKAGSQKDYAGDHNDVQDCGAQGRDEKVTSGIRHADQYSSKTNQQHVGKHEAQKLQHEFSFLVEFMQLERNRNSCDGKDGDCSGR